MKPLVSTLTSEKALCGDFWLSAWIEKVRMIPSHTFSPYQSHKPGVLTATCVSLCVSVCACVCVCVCVCVCLCVCLCVRECVIHRLVCHGWMDWHGWALLHLNKWDM